MKQANCNFPDSAARHINTLKCFAFIEWFIFYNAFVAQPINWRSVCTAEECVEVHPGEETVWLTVIVQLAPASLSCHFVLQHFPSPSRQMSCISLSLLSLSLTHIQYIHTRTYTHSWVRWGHSLAKNLLGSVEQAAKANRRKLYQSYYASVCEAVCVCVCVLCFWLLSQRTQKVLVNLFILSHISP